MQEAGDEVRIIPVHGIGEVAPGANLSTLLHAALAASQQRVLPGDVVVVTQKIVSKAEGRLVNLADIEPSPFARQIAAQGRKEAAYYEVVLRESRRIVRMNQGVLITETHHGLICANAGVDESNIGGERCVALLPVDPDASAAALCAALSEQAGGPLAVIISDTFGRPWREGQVNVAIGVAGIDPLIDYVGQPDSHGHTMQASKLAIGDELACAAELVMGKVARVPVAIIRGYRGYTAAPPGSSASSARRLLRDPAFDLFR
jgi:coenzyme F420-0:L-glutamate ligase/coenzyme F420-1:gamma-L-glutamate ligase